MACTTLTDILRGCTTNIGGLFTEAYLNDMENITSETLNDTTFEVTARVVSTPYVKFQFGRNAGSYNEERQTSIDNGSDFYMQKAMFKLFLREASKSKAIKIAGEGQRFLSIIVKDNNGKFWDLRNMQLTADTGGSGVNKADGSNYDIEFTGENISKCYEVDPTIIPVLIA